MLLRNHYFLLLLLLVSSNFPAFAQKLLVAPTTTLKQQTSNNTSASNSFVGQNNGNVGARNISKLPIKNLLYPSASTKVLAHLQLWFGTRQHINVGYNSNDPVQVERQMIDMAGRGIDGVLVDWYGRNNTFIDSAALVVLNESAKQDLSFGLVVDGGGLRTCSSTPGCNVTQQMIADLQHASSVFYSAAHYIKREGRPVIYFFGMSSSYQINWPLVRASTPGNPLFVFLSSHDNSNGFDGAQSDGGFGWLSVSSDPYDLGLPYLVWYYDTAARYPNKIAVGSVFKGFNDSFAPWAPAPARVMEQQCGKTWLAGFKRINQTYSTDLQLEVLQLVTWNDYEEGSEIESGIDNCLAISPRIEKTATSAKLMWSLSGNEDAVNHYTVYISTDGENLMSLGDRPVGTREFDLRALELDEATYTFFVQAIGKPSIVNTMSVGVSYHPTNNAPVVALSMSPESGPAPLQVIASTLQSTDSDGEIVASRIDFGDGTVAPTTEATHTYNANGIYRVTATVTDNTGLSSVQTFSVMVGDTHPPNAVLAVTPTRGVAPLTVNASTVGSSDSDGSIVSTTIDFGDGAVIQGSASSRLYHNPGTYTVKATVTDNQGASTTATQTIIVAPAPGVTITSPALGLSVASPVRITASASSNAPITAMHAYVDGYLVHYIYDKRLDVSVSLTKGWRHVVVQAWDGLGRLYRSEVNVNVIAPPNTPPFADLAVTPETGRAPLLVNASTSKSHDPDGSIQSSTIDFGDGTIANGPSASRTYTLPGTYVITATVTDDLGGRSTTSRTVQVDPAPNTLPLADLVVTPETGRAPLLVNASTSKSHDPDGSIQSSTIDFGDGTIANGPSASRTYTLPGTYVLTATVTDDLGGRSTTSRTVQVDPAPNTLPLADLVVTPETGRAPLLVNASTSKSHDPDGSIQSSTIDFGDGTIANGPSASRTYTLPGTYTITATVTDNLGGRSTTSRTVQVNPAHAIGVQITSPAEGATVTSPVRITAGAGSTRPITAMHVYVDHKLAYQSSANTVDVQLHMAAGKRLVVVQAWDSAGTVYKASVSPNIVTSATNQPPVARLSLTPTSGNAPVSVAASTTASTDVDGSIQSSIIDFGNGTVLAGPNASYTYTVPGTYSVRASVTDNAGASSVATGSVTVASSSGVQIWTPTHGTSMGSPVRITATASAAKPITAMHVYVDHVQVFKRSAANLDTSFAMARGSRLVVVQAWDSAGTVYKASVTITVR